MENMYLFVSFDDIFVANKYGFWFISRGREILTVCPSESKTAGEVLRVNCVGIMTNKNGGV